MSTIYQPYGVGLFLVLVASLKMIAASPGFKWEEERRCKGQNAFQLKLLFFNQKKTCLRAPPQ